MKEQTREKIAQSDVFLAIVTTNYIKDPDAIEQAMYANALKKPVILLVECGAGSDDVNGLFKDTTIVDVIPFKKEDDSFKDRVVESIKVSTKQAKKP